MARQRNYKLEYKRRVERGEAAGKSRSASRGHARASDLERGESAPIDRSSPLEKALARMRRGQSQASAAAAEGVTTERLRRYRELNTASRFERGSWVIFDSRPQGYQIVSEGKRRSVILANDDGSTVSAYWRAVDAFLYSNDEDLLHPFEGEGVYDKQSRFHQFETRPNVLRKLESIGELSFVEIYAEGGDNGGA